MGVNPNSPNGCFERHGYTIERRPGPDGSKVRTIRNPEGEVVLQGAGYDAEIAFCKENSLMIEDQI